MDNIDLTTGKEFLINIIKAEHLPSRQMIRSLEELADLRPMSYIPHGNDFLDEGAEVSALHILVLPNYNGWPLFPESMIDYNKFLDEDLVEAYGSDVHLPWECDWSSNRFGEDKTKIPFRRFKKANEFLKAMYKVLGSIDLEHVETIWITEPTQIVYNTSEANQCQTIIPDRPNGPILRPDNGLKLLLGHRDLEIELTTGDRYNVTVNRMGGAYLHMTKQNSAL
jgi:hypothetical protein